MVRLLEMELKRIGLVEIHLDENDVLMARLSRTVAEAPRIGFCAHVDTGEVGLSADIHPSRVLFTGQDLCLNPARDIWFRVVEHPELLPYVGQELIVTDGTCAGRRQESGSDDSDGPAGWGLPS